jgi:hypothetical protein
MPNSNISSRPAVSTCLILAILALVGSFGVVLTTANDIDLGVAVSGPGLTSEESAYYEYVSPRLDRLVTEVDQVVVMVEGKSRDILALTISGNRIEDLSRQITGFGETNGVPGRFQAIHDQVLTATNTTTYTFGQAREALRSFNFSNMSNLVTDFQIAATQLHEAQDDMRAAVGGTKDAMANTIRAMRDQQVVQTLAFTEQE